MNMYPFMMSQDRNSVSPHKLGVMGSVSSQSFGIASNHGSTTLPRSAQQPEYLSVNPVLSPEDDISIRSILSNLSSEFDNAPERNMPPKFPTNYTETSLS